MYRFIEYQDVKDEKFVHSIYPGDDFKFYLNYNWYWNGIVKLRKELVEKYIVLDDEVVGYVVYGPHFSDRLLENRIQGIAEIYHIILDSNHHGRGVGGQVMHDITSLLLKLDVYKKVYVAFAPSNSGAENFYKNVGFTDTSIKNYDDDPIFEILNIPTAKELKDADPSRKIDSSIRSDWEKGSRESLSEWSWNDWRAGRVT